MEWLINHKHWNMVTDFYLVMVEEMNTSLKKYFLELSSVVRKKNTKLVVLKSCQTYQEIPPHIYILAMIPTAVWTKFLLQCTMQLFFYQ